MKVCILGFGSIGKRHAQILTEQGHEVYVVSRHSPTSSSVFSDFRRCLEQNPDLNIVIIANETSLHANSLKEVSSSFKGLILVEKPLFQEWLPDLKIENEQRVFVAYNLRFHPIVQKIRELIANEEILSVHVYVGQYLPNWRPGTDYSLSYSASQKKGGGVLRDLSHELDYCFWLFGDWKKLKSLGGKLSDLKIDSDDFCSVVYESAKSPIVTINLNYLDHIGQREILINTNKWTLKADLMKGTINLNSVVTQYPTERNTTYEAQLKALISDQKDICTFQQGLKVMKMINEIGDSQKKETH